MKLKEKVSKTLPNETGGVRGRKAEKTQVVRLFPTFALSPPLVVFGLVRKKTFFLLFGYGQ